MTSRGIIISIWAKKMIKTIVNSGPIASKMPTGTAITRNQSAAILVQNLTDEKPIRFHSASFILDSSLVLDDCTITLSLCEWPNNSSLIKERCVESNSFGLPRSRKKVNAEWQSQLNPLLNTSIPYWLVMEGNSLDFDHSFSWMDAANFKASTAFSTDGSWTITKDTIGASTLVFTVIVD